MSWVTSISDERWADIIGHLSLLSAAGFGLLALLTDYKKDGKITFWGRVAVAGIALSTVLSIASGTVQDRIQAQADIKARDDRDIQTRRFTQQIAVLRGLNANMVQVNGRSATLLARIGQSIIAQNRVLAAQDRVLTTQSTLLSNARRSMRLTAGLTTQERENTGRVLRSLWDEANRVVGSRLEVLVTTTCRSGQDETTPLLFQNGQALVSVLDEDEAQADASGELEGWGALILVARGLYSFRQESVTATIERLQTMTRFHSFIAFQPDEVASPDLWRTGYVKVLIFAPAPASYPGMAEASADAPSEEVPSRRNRIAGYERDLPCEASATVIVNGRMVADASGQVVLTREGDGTAMVTLDARAVPVDDDSLPTYSGR